MSNVNYNNAQTTKLTQIETDDALAGDGTYTSQWVDVSQYAELLFSCKADVQGTIYAQQSNTGNEGPADAVPSQQVHTIFANSDDSHRMAKTKQFFRIRYVNDSVAQTSFHIQCFAGSVGMLAVASNSIIRKNQDALLIRQMPYQVDIARGLFQGYSPAFFFGRNSDIDTTTTPEDLWEAGGIYTGHPVSTVETLQLFSSDTNDTLAGTGARTAMIIGLDANWNLWAEIVNLNGTTPVTTSSTFRRVTRIRVTAAGSTGHNVGTLTCRHSSTTANVFCFVQPTSNQSYLGAYTVPANTEFYLEDIRATVNRAAAATGNADVILKVRPFGEVYQSIFSLNTSTAYTQSLPPGFQSGRITEKSDIKITVNNVTGNDTTVTVNVVGVLVTDDD